MSPDYIPLYLWQSRVWIKRDFQRGKSQDCIVERPKLSCKSNFPDYMHIAGDFSGLHSYLFFNAAKEQ